MLYGIKYIASYLLGTDIAGRNLRVFPDDTFIASYPRSGNTWTRFLLANLMHPQHSITFANIEAFIPDATALSSRQLKRAQRPRLIKTHEYFEPRYRKVIYLVRDPRDVALSLYNFRRKYRSVDDSCPIERYVAERFLPGDLDVSWGEHVGSWLGTRMNQPGFLLVRYEDLLQEPLRELGRLAEFLGVSASTETLALAIERSSANRLRQLEKSEHEAWVTTKGKRADVPFIAEAVAGAWKQKLPTPSVALIESAWGHLMNSLGYETSVRSSLRAIVA
ncbi:MAG: sulfotransferase domain-containing protein [Sinobacteraceae bacterium]|nr:sulfotransferase domain-containing protein [Nevskiaceae bacterium]MBV9317110.1 sulfotransferase domain-containing protein [Gammaproteobacteria bacterium]MBV9723857.1 sulfotransferase domain-containing protein [Gammaproteobacteria bacterium]